jgi:hypothetical protein
VSYAGWPPPERKQDSDASRDYTADEQQIVDVFKLLRKAVVKHHATHTQEVTAFQKMLKRLLKKRPVLKDFVEYVAHFRLWYDSYRRLTGLCCIFTQAMRLHTR